MGSVIAHENILGSHIGTKLQFHTSLFRIVVLEGCTVSATEDITTDNGRLLLRTYNMDRNLFGMRSDGSKGVYRTYARVIIQIAPSEVGGQGGIVGVRIGAVTSAIDATVNTGTYTYGITAPYLSLNIVAAIYVIDFTASYQQTGRKTGWEIV